MTPASRSNQSSAVDEHQAAAAAQSDCCCRDIARLLALRNDPSLNPAQRLALAVRVVRLCDQLQALCACA